MADGEVLAEADGLAVGDGFLVGAGFADLLGRGPAVGLDAVVGSSATTLGVTVGDGRRCVTTLRDGLTLGEFGCGEVVVPGLPLAWLGM